jgi:urea carboxylase-associated protein 2
MQTQSTQAVLDIPDFSREFASDIARDKVLWTELIPGGGHWSYRVKRGTTLRFVDLEGGANVSLLLYRADERHERLNIPDTLKSQHTAHLAAGNVLYSDMGRILAAIAKDTVGWHDPLCGLSDAANIQRKYGDRRYQEHRNAMHRNGKDSMLIEIGKGGLSIRDLVPNVNLFSKVIVDHDGKFQFIANHSKKNDFVELRFEMDTLVAVSTAPHPLDTSTTYAPKKVGIVAWDSGPGAADDPCRLSCPENQRGYYNTELVYR